MELLTVIILGVIQGVTEFLPISSTAHLIIFEDILGFDRTNLVFEVILHSGTLLAVLVYFSFIETLKNKKLFAFLVVATIPVGIAGLALNNYIDILFNPLLIASSTFVFGLLLVVSEKYSGSRKTENMTLKDSIIVGFLQIFALIPGTSRSGVTITAGMFLGLTKKDALRFSFLLSVPVIAGSILLKIQEVDLVGIDYSTIVVGFVVSFITAILVIHYFLRFVNKIGFKAFFIYRIFLSVFILTLFVF